MQAYPETPTIGLLYCGEMGAALARFLRATNHHVLTAVRQRSPRTRRLALEAGCEIVDDIGDVIAKADVVFSTVTPSAATTVANAVAECSHDDHKITFVDVNSISPNTARNIARVIEDRGHRFVDMTIRGLASRLLTHGEVYLSGLHAAAIAKLFATLHVECLGPAPDAASTQKMLMSGMSKGVAALFVEMALAAERAGLSERFLAGVQRHYPDIFDAMTHVLPTYPKHVGRRSEELAELNAMFRELRIEPHLTHAARQLWSTIASTPWCEQSLPAGSSLRAVVEAIAGEHPIDLAARISNRIAPLPSARDA